MKNMKVCLILAILSLILLLSVEARYWQNGNHASNGLTIAIFTVTTLGKSWWMKANV
jgi:hypothetical protein